MDDQSTFDTRTTTFISRQQSRSLQAIRRRSLRSDEDREINFSRSSANCDYDGRVWAVVSVRTSHHRDPCTYEPTVDDMAPSPRILVTMVTKSPSQSIVATNLAN